MTWRQTWWIASFCLLAVLLAGCRRSPTLDDRDAIAALLPRGLRLGDRIPFEIRNWEEPQKPPPGPYTVEEELYKVGAKVGPNNQLQDSNGVEIVFVEKHFLHGDFSLSIMDQDGQEKPGLATGGQQQKTVWVRKGDPRTSDFNGEVRDPFPNKRIILVKVFRYK